MCFGFKEMRHLQNCRLSMASLTRSISNALISCSQETASLTIFVLGTASLHSCGTQTCPLRLLGPSCHCTFEFSSLRVCHRASLLSDAAVWKTFPWNSQPTFLNMYALSVSAKDSSSLLHWVMASRVVT